MEPISEPTPTKYQQVTVDVPAERVAEFHAFFARFLAGRGRRRGRGEHRHHAHPHGHGCTARHERAKRSEAYERAADTPGQTTETREV